jgi:hypothetical protein
LPLWKRKELTNDRKNSLNSLIYYLLYLYVHSEEGGPLHQPGPASVQAIESIDGLPLSRLSSLFTTDLLWVIELHILVEGQPTSCSFSLFTGWNRSVEPLKYEEVDSECLEASHISLDSTLRQAPICPVKSCSAAALADLQHPFS